MRPFREKHVPFLYATGRSALFLLASPCFRKFAGLLESGQLTGVLELASRGEHDFRGFDLRGVELLFRDGAGRADREAETADLPELHDTSGAQVLVEDVVHPVHDRLDVRRG